MRQSIRYQLARVKRKLTGTRYKGLKGLMEMSESERQRLQRLPRYTSTHSPLLARKIELTDPYWYLHCYKEIFNDRIYAFRANRPDPLIIDCGANIGMSVIFFKSLYPDAKIIAFEPDDEIFKVLERNVRTFALQDVALYRNAVWNSNATLMFRSDGSVGGHITDDDSEPGEGRLILVESARLKDYLRVEVDFLKVDIEGAEYEVIRDCQDDLSRVRYFFCEYHGKSSEPQTLHEILAIIRTSGFRYHIKEAWPVDHPFLTEERRSVYDLQLNIFAFRD